MSPIAGEMLSSLAAQNVVGVALVPDYLRHPIGMGRPLVSPADFDGARVRIQPSLVTAALMKALGAVPVAISNSQIGYAIGQKRIDGQELRDAQQPRWQRPRRQCRALRQSDDAVREPRFVSTARRRTIAQLRDAAAETVRHAVARNPTDAEIATHFCFDRRRIVLATRPSS